MIENMKKSEGYIEGTTYFKLFDKNIDISIEEEAGLDYAHLCIEALNSLDSNHLEQLCKAAILYCEDFCEMVGEEPPNLGEIRDILQYLEIEFMTVDEPKDNKNPVVHLGGSCEWEPEHGIEIVFRNGELLYLGAYDGVWVWEEQEHYENEYSYAYLAKQSKFEFQPSLETYQIEPPQPLESIEEVLRALNEYLGKTVPEDYISFVGEYGDVEIKVRDIEYQPFFRIWGIRYAAEMNPAIHVQKYIPDSLAIGDDTGGYVLLYMNGNDGFGIYKTGFGDLDREDAIFLAPSLTSMLKSKKVLFKIFED